MHEDHYIDTIVRDLTPTPDAMREFEVTLCAVERALGDLDIPTSRFGSYARQTRLAEHPIADLALTFEPSGDRPLHGLAEDLQQRLPEARVLATRGTLALTRGAHTVDLVPVGLNPEGDLDKLRYASLGQGHVAWYLQGTQGQLTPVVLGLKQHRVLVRELHRLPPIALEALAVLLLGSGPAPSLDVAFATVIAALSNGMLNLRGELGRLPDPVAPTHDLLHRLTEHDRDVIQRIATRTLRAIEHDTWSQVFPKGAVLPTPAINLGGQTLA